VTEDRRKQLLAEINGKEILCDYCPLPDESKGVHCYGGNPVMCEGKCCPEAMERYLEEMEDEDGEVEERNEILKQAIGEINIIAKQLREISKRIGSTVSVMCNPEYYSNCVFIHDERFIGENEVINGATILRSRPSEEGEEEQ
jgi:hypothetical protein